MLSLLKGLEQQEESLEFLHPVDHAGLGLDDYLTIVTTPMDLSTVRKNAKGGKYGDVREALADVQLIWENCRKYNLSDSLIAKQADIMEHHAKRICQKLKLDYSAARRREAATGTVTHAEKVEFCERVKQAPHETLARVVKRVQVICPRASEVLQDDKVQIRVDMLDRAAFNELLDLVCEDSGEIAEVGQKRQRGNEDNGETGRKPLVE